jgi:uncharacterized membrane protein
MTHTMKPNLIKLAWAVFILAGAPFVFFLAPGKHEWVHAAAVIAVGLGMFFFARETVEDERVALLKLKAVRASLVGALNFTLLMNLFVLNPREPDVVSRSLTAFDFAAIAMLGSLILFYYWRWQDGRPGRDA